jgi:23S rRNA pseudouridine2605 synthase
MKIRLNKYLSECGIASRRKSEEYILQGRVTVNKKIVEELSFTIDPLIDEVSVDGEKVKQKKHLYFLLNKPKGYITTTDDDKRRKKVVDLIPTKEKIFPVGRLDYDTTGVLILTNDGDFTNFLTHPKNNIKREYEVKLDKPLEAEDEKKLLNGVFLDGKRGKFLHINFETKNRHFCIVKCSEGRNHFIKNMFQALGYMVVELNRKSFADITVKGMHIGSFRVLTKKEIQEVYKKYA